MDGEDVEGPGEGESDTDEEDGKTTTHHIVVNTKTVY